MPEPVASWNPARGVWETTRASLCGHSEVFSETWPASGTTRAGSAYAQPTWEHRTAGSACSSSPSLLKTPTSQLAVNGGSQHPDKRKAGGHGPTLADEIEHLLPTPLSRDGKGEAANPARTGGPSLPDAVQTLLPTPGARASNDGEGPETWLARRERVKAARVNGNGMGMPLTIAVQLLPSTGAPTPPPSSGGSD